MERIVIVVDTNVWAEVEYLFNRLKELTDKKGYREMWLELDVNLLSETEKHKYKGAIKFVDRILDLQEHSREKIIEIHVPSFVYNEKAYGTSSKFKKPQPKESVVDNERNFRDLLLSLPDGLEVITQKNKLKEGEDYPEKPKDIKSTDIKKEMEEFILKQQKVNENLQFLLQHLANSDEEDRLATQKRTTELQHWIKEIHDKFTYWDKPMGAVLERDPFKIRYNTKTKKLDVLNGKIQNYPLADERLFELGPEDVLAERLTMEKEEFDFFDLQIYLYAKEKNAFMLTLNTQAFQEVSDPRFLGYFEDIKIMNPLINFDSIRDLEESGDLIEIVKKTIETDFDDDVRIFSSFNENLDEPVLGETVKKIIDDMNLEYANSGKKLKDIINEVPLSEALKLFKFEDNQLKLSKKSLFSEPSSESKINVLKFIDKNFFQNELSFSDFVIDSELKTRYKLIQIIKAPGVYDRLRAFLNNGETNLQEFISAFKRGDPVMAYFTALFVESHFKEKDIESQINSVSPDLEPIPPNKCPIRSVARKREAGKCLLTWEDVEHFNEKPEERDPKKILINSDRFLEYLKMIKDPVQRIQLIQFVDQVINLAVNAEEVVSGSREAELTHLINHHKVIDHFGKVGRVSGALNYGMAAKNILGDLLEGNIEGVAMNIGFLSTAGGLSELAEISLARGAKYIESGRLVLGNSLKFASPFIGRLLSPLIALDLYSQVKALNQGDKDAIVNIVGDSIYLGIDTIEIGVSIVEALGVISGVSAVTGPIGLAIGAIVFIATDIYFAVRKVDKIDNVIHLTTGERWEVGAMSFFHLGVPHYIEDLLNMKSANNKLVQQGMNFLKQNDKIQRYVLPSAIINSETSQVELARDSSVIPQQPSIKWHRARPDDPEGGRIFCAPQGDWETPPSDIILKCENAIGIEDLGTKSNNYTIYNLGDGDDTIYGFPNSPNIFRIGAGHKSIEGGKKDDVFVIDSGLTVWDFPAGIVDGMEGNNTLDLGGLAGETVNVYFDDSPSIPRVVLSQGNKYGEIEFRNIRRIIGRKDEKDDIYPNCVTKYINGQGGKPEAPDVIDISASECNHNKVIYLGPNTKVQNLATSGKFSYFINDVHSNINCSLISPAVEGINNPTDTERKWPQQVFFLNTTLEDVQKIEFLHEKENYYDLDIYLYFKNQNGISHRFVLDIVLGNQTNISGRLDQTFIYLKDDTQLRLHNDGLIGLLKTDKPVPDIIERYRHVGNKLGISLFILNESEGTTVSIGSDRRDDILYNDPRYSSYLIGNKGNNVYMVASGQYTLTSLKSVTLPQITIYISDGSNHTNVLDLRPLSNQIKKDLRLTEMRIQHFFELEDLVIDLTAVESTKESGVLRPWSYDRVTSIRIKNTPMVTDWDSWCKHLQVILNNAPVVLNCSTSYRDEFSRNPGNQVINLTDIFNYNPSTYYTPLPLVFSGYEVIALSKNDVERYTEVIVNKKLGKYRFLRYEADLVLTNGFDFEEALFHPCTIIFKHFYNHFNVFYTLSIKYYDRTISLNEERRNIQNAKPLEDYYEEYHDKANNISNPITNTERIKRNVNMFKEGFPLLSNSHQHRGTIDGNKKTPSGLLGLGVIGTAIHSLVQFGSEHFGYIRDYFGSFVTPIPMHLSNVMNQQKERQFSHQHSVDSKSNIDMRPSNNYSSVEVNSTLLLLDVLVRKLNDSKYKLPAEDCLLSPLEKVERKLEALTTELKLDPTDVAGSLEEQHRKLLKNMTGF